jgi:hypothetical protein
LELHDQIIRFHFENSEKVKKKEIKVFTLEYEVHKRVSNLGLQVDLLIGDDSIPTVPAGKGRSARGLWSTSVFENN